MSQRFAKIRKKDMPLICCCVGLFAFPCILRFRVMGSFALINFITYAALYFGYKYKVMNLPLSTDKKIGKMAFFSAYFILAIVLLFVVQGNGWSTIRRILLIFVYVLPALFVGTSINESMNTKRYVQIWIKWLRLICRIMCIAWVLDKLLGNSIQNIWVALYDSSTLAFLVRNGRFVSYYGHSLTNAGLFIMLLVWTTIEKNEYKEIKGTYILDVFNSFCGIAICGTKSGLMLAVMLVLLCNVGLRKTKYMVGILLMLVVLYFSGLFDLVISRLLEGFASGDISTSRNSSLESLMTRGVVSFQMLEGHEFDYSSVAMVAALEYPFLQWSFTMGIAFAIIQYCMYFIYPGIKALISKKWCVFICILILMAYYNGNNGIVSFNDDLLMYAVNIWLIIQVLGKGKQKNG